MAVPIEWNLSGKTALITADRRGWTPFFAAALAEAGADVVVAGSATSELENSVKEIERKGRRGLPIITDITSTHDIELMVEQVKSELGKIDILVNNATAEFAKPFLEVTEWEWDTLMAFNVKSVFLCSQAIGRFMIETGGGRIVNISSGLSVRGLWNSAVSCAAEGAIHQLTSALALEWGRKNIRVNSIGAGWMTTEQQTEASKQELLVRYLPSRRKGHPSDLCGLLVYLSSDACSFVNGQTIFIDGGALAHA